MRVSGYESVFILIVVYVLYLSENGDYFRIELYDVIIWLKKFISNPNITTTHPTKHSQVHPPHIVNLLHI